MVKCFQPHELDPAVFIAQPEDRQIDCRQLIANLLSEPAAREASPLLLPLARRVLTAEAEVMRLRGELSTMRWTHNPPMQ